MRELLSVSIFLAEKGGAELVKIFNSGYLKTKEKTGKSDLVTKGDHASHEIMYFGMKKAFSSISVISEETSENEKSVNFNIEYRNTLLNRILVSDELIPSETITVWIDPLDATKEYTEGLKQYVTTMVGIAIDGEAVAGVIHFPFSGQTYWGWVEHGNNIQEQNEKSKVGSFIISRSHTGKSGDMVKAIMGDKAEVIKAGGAGYKIIELFNGGAETYFHEGKIKKWDICAGQAILRSTCYGKMTDLNGDTIQYSADSDHVVHPGFLASMHNYENHFKKFHEFKEKEESKKAHESL
jgi:inositol monophosphatase 3